MNSTSVAKIQQIESFQIPVLKAFDELGILGIAFKHGSKLASRNVARTKVMRFLSLCGHFSPVRKCENPDCLETN